MLCSFCVFSITDALNCIIFLAYYEYTSREGQTANLSCMPEYEESYTYTDYKAPMHVHIIVDNVTYTLASHYGCLHNLTYGVKDRCDNLTSCTFEVTNANVASQCGTEGEADLWVRYHCVSEYNSVYFMTSYNAFSNWLTSLVTFFDKKVIFTSCDVI